MFPPGHYGIALALYAVVGYALLLRGYTHDARWGGIVVLSFALSPDLDGKFAVLSHRAVTHTLWFALAVGTVCVLIVASTLRQRSRREAIRGGLWAFFLGAFAVLTHLFADLLNPWGIMPVYPLSPALYSLDLVRAPSEVANYGMLLAGIVAVTLAWVAGRPRRPQSSLAVRLYRRLRGREPAPE